MLDFDDYQTVYSLFDRKRLHMMLKKRHYQHASCLWHALTKENINGILTYGCKIYLFWSVTNEDIKRYLTAERDAMKTGYSIKTWKMRLFCPEKQMIETTEALYREAVAFYYELLKEKERKRRKRIL